MSIIDGKGQQERERLALQSRLEMQEASSYVEYEEMKEIYVNMCDAAKERVGVGVRGFHLESLWDTIK